MATYFLPQRSPTDYMVACICLTGVSKAVVGAMLDNGHLGNIAEFHNGYYSLGDVGGHNVVIADGFQYHSRGPAAAAAQLLLDFPAIRFALLVGIGSGVPDLSGKSPDIRLGDVAVSDLTNPHGGILEFDTDESYIGRFTPAAHHLNKTSRFLQSTIDKVVADHRILRILPVQSSGKWGNLVKDYSYPGAWNDLLFSKDCLHSGGETCRNCDKDQLIMRQERQSMKPHIHYGTIVSAKAVVRDTDLRERMQLERDSICIETEAAGIMNCFPCLVICGICDYADSHSNERWQSYASLAAVAYMTELLHNISPQQVRTLSPPRDIEIEDRTDNRAVFFFDIDNCLYPKSSKVHDHVVKLINKYLAAYLTYSVNEADRLRKEYNKDYGLTVEGLARHHDIDPLDFNRQVDDALPLDELLSPDRGLRLLLESFDTTKVKLWLFTSSHITHAVRVVKLLGIDDLFEGITYCDYAERPLCPKPSPTMFEKAEREAGCTPSTRKYFVDNSWRNCMAAYNRGWMNTVHLVDSLQPDNSDDTAAPPCDYRIRNLTELVGLFPELFRNSLETSMVDPEADHDAHSYIDNITNNDLPLLTPKLIESINTEPAPVEYETPTLAVPTDSGYESMKLAIGHPINNLAEDEQSVYSVDSLIDVDSEAQVIDEFIHRLIADLDIRQAISAACADNNDDFDGIFLDFALRLGYDDTLTNHLEIAKFVRRRRGDLVSALRNYNTRKADNDPLTEAEDSRSSSDDEAPLRPDGSVMSAEEKIQWWRTVDTTEFPKSETDDFSKYQDPPVQKISITEKLQNVVYDSFAYRWLLSAIRKTSILTNSNPSTTAKIRQAILAAFPTPKKVGRRSAVSACSAVFEVAWNLRSFLDDQVPNWQRDDGIDRILTLTGGLTDVQADTCMGYMQQTWPMTGAALVRTINDTLATEKPARISQPGHLDLVAREEGPQLIVEATGVRGAIVEVGEQLCWLSSALKCADSRLGVQQSVPTLSATESPVNDPKVFKIISHPIRTELGNISDGTCWRDLFQKVILVGGFPTQKRPLLCPGLEIPLNVAGDLIGVHSIIHFNHISRLKGHSAILYPTKQVSDIVVWHLNVARGGTTMSYLDGESPPLKCEKPAELYRRHIVGWSESTISLVGTEGCNYDVQPANMKPVETGNVFSDCVLAPPSLLQVERSFRIPKDYYRELYRSVPLPAMMQRLGGHVVCFWDVSDRRGWLVSGIAALAHLVRASIEKDQEFPTDLRPQGPLHLHEPSDPYSSSAPARFLCNPSNWNAVLLRYPYEGDTKVETFGDRAGHLYEFLDQIIYYQDKCRRASKRSTRAKLESWDFHSLVAQRFVQHRALHVRIASGGMSWVDLLRDAKIPTLCGSGFGDLILPGRNETSTLCPRWRTLPLMKYYLAASMPILMKIMMNSGGSATRSPRRLTRSLNWIAPGRLFQCCGCHDGTVNDEHVQVLLQRKLDPPWSTNVTCNLSSASLTHESLVVFGHNNIQDWHWPDSGPPQKGGVHLPTQSDVLEDCSSSEDETTSDEAVSSSLSRDTTSPLTSMIAISSDAALPTSGSNNYGDSVVKGSGYLHQGDYICNNIVNNYSGTPPSAFTHETAADTTGGRSWLRSSSVHSPDSDV